MRKREKRKDEDGVHLAERAMRFALRVHGLGEHLPVLLFAGQPDGFIRVAESPPIVAGLEAGESLTAR